MVDSDVSVTVPLPGAYAVAYGVILDAEIF
jgi:hypothetical protein